VKLTKIPSFILKNVFHCKDCLPSVGIQLLVLNHILFEINFLNFKVCKKFFDHFGCLISHWQNDIGIEDGYR